MREERLRLGAGIAVASKMEATEEGKGRPLPDTFDRGRRRGCGRFGVLGPLLVDN